MRTSLLLPILLLAAVSGCAPVMVATPRIHTWPDADPYSTVAAEFRTPEVPILFATDRKPEEDSTEQDRHYTFERSRSLAFGIATVRFGQELTWSDIVELTRTQSRTGPIQLSLDKTEELGRIPETTYDFDKSGRTLQVTPNAAEATALAEQMLRTMVESRLATSARKDVFLFIHGYSNTFQDAAFTMAQVWHFLGRQGVPFIYSWPAGSSGLLRGYTHDRESGEFTIFRLKQTLRLLSHAKGLNKIHVIAHSRGTDVFLTALRELFLEDGRRVEGDCFAARLGTVVLAAPDLDFDVLASRVIAEGLFMVPDHLAVYVSEGDSAIGISKWLFTSLKRLGRLRSADLSPEALARLKTFTNIEVIDARVYGYSSWGHDYFYAHPAVSSDLIWLLRDGKTAGVSGGRPLRREEDSFWILDNEYPGKSEK